MSEVYMVWAKYQNLAKARHDQIVNGLNSQILSSGQFKLAQAEDISNHQSINSGDECYCIVFKLL